MAGDDILKQSTIAQHLRTLYKEVRALKRESTLKQREEGFEGSEAPNNNNYATEFRAAHHVCIVSSVIDANTFLAARAIPATADATGWEADSEFAEDIVVTKAPQVTLPSSGDVVSAHFTGIYSVTQPRYGYFRGVAPMAGRWSADAITTVPGNGTYTTLEAVPGDLDWSVGPAATMSAGAITFGEEFDGRIVVVGAYMQAGNSTPPGYEQTNATEWLRIRQDYGVGGGNTLVADGYLGTADSGQLTTDTADGHTHTIPGHNHETWLGNLSSGVWAVSTVTRISSGDVVKAQLRQFTGFNAEVDRFHIWYYTIG